MKKEKRVVYLRRRNIINLMKNKPQTMVKELSEIFEVSPITIRRDLQYLEDKNLLTRFYGGATINDDFEMDIDDSQFYRRKISEYAASLVEDGDSIFINTSKTAIDILNYIEANDVTCITNNGRVIGKNYKNKINILLTGGELRGEKMSLVGDLSLQNLENIYPKKTFMGCSGLSPISGMTTENSAEMKINKQAIENTTGDVYILCDHTKIGISSSFTSAPIDSIKHLITDEKVDKNILKELKDKGVIIHIVKKKDDGVENE